MSEEILTAESVTETPAPRLRSGAVEAPPLPGRPGDATPKLPDLSLPAKTGWVWRGWAGRLFTGARARVAAMGWPLPALLALLALTAVLYLWGLSSSGWANSYYAAAVQAGSKSWKAWFFGAFDSSSFITVDKTPGALWLMGLSARVFGLSSWSLLAPEALCGVATVGVTYAAVKRWWGPVAGLIAGAVIAATPVAALMFRFNNPEALFTLVLVLAAYATLRAVEGGKTRWLILAGVLVGFGFLTKMLEAFLVLPAFAVAYFATAKPRLLKRVWQLGLAVVAVAVSASWWAIVVQLWPVASRPFIGGSTNNSVWELAFGYNGLGRLSGNEVGAVGPGGAVGGNWANAQLFGATGLGRLFRGTMAGEISWLLPAALVAIVACVLLACVYRKRASSTGRMFRAAVIVWAGWLLVTGVVFSYMQGIIHPYYNVVLAPPMGALMGMAVVELWRRRDHFGWRVLLAAIPAAGAVWSFHLLQQVSGWLPSLRWIILVIGLAASVTLLVYGWPNRARWARTIGIGITAIALMAALGGSTAWALATAAQPHSGAIPASGPQGVSVSFSRNTGNRGFAGGPTRPGTGNAKQAPSATNNPWAGAGSNPRSLAQGNAGGFGSFGVISSVELVALLQKDAASYKWVAVMSAASTAAPLQLSASAPIMARGGFNGTDQSITLKQFEALVAAHEIHYYIVGGGYANSPNSGVERDIANWVSANFTKASVGSTTVYDLTATPAGGTAS